MRGGGKWGTPSQHALNPLPGRTILFALLWGMRSSPLDALSRGVSFWPAGELEDRSRIAHAASP